MATRLLSGLVLGLAIFGLIGFACAEQPTHGDHAAETSINPIPMSWDQVQKDLAVWTAVVFLCLFAVLWKFAWKPIAEGLDKRERNMADQIAQAEAANRRAGEILADYEARLAAAQDQVRAIVDQGRRDAEQVGRDLIQKSKEEAEAEYARALKQIDAATAGAIKELANQSATLAVELAGKIVRAKLSPADHTRLIEQAVSGFGQGTTGASRVSNN